jgi:FKBP12-rapamycin complex-associated protein
MDDRVAQAEALAAGIREHACATLFPAFGENYERTYVDFARVASTTELMEVIEYKKLQIQARSAVQRERDEAKERLVDIRRVWDLRFTSLDQVTEILQSVLCIRSLVLTVTEQRQHFLKFLAVTIEERRIGLGSKILEYCLARDPCVDFEIMKLRLMFELPGETTKDQAVAELSNIARLPEHVLILCRWLHDRTRYEEACQWLCSIAEQSATTPPLWDLWSQVNLALYNKQKGVQNLLDAFHGVTNGLLLSPDNSLTLTLRLLRILFKRDVPQVLSLFETELQNIPVFVWIPVLPQLLSRLASRNAQLQAIIETLLVRVGKIHPQAVIFPLMVPLSLDNLERQRISREVVAKIAQYHPDLHEAVTRFSAELVRVSTTWWEMVVGQVDEADHAYAERHNADEMLDILGTLSALAHKTPVSFYETAFLRAHAEQLRSAEALWHIYRHNRDDASLNALWHHFTTVFYGCRPLVRAMRSCEIADVSPYLAKLTPGEMFVPGTYTPGIPLVSIQAVCSKVSIIDSKQRPRKISFLATDGRTHGFLLKAHEDTRLDERVMQLFSVINTFVAGSQIPLRDKLLITTYKVIPLTGEVGLIGWVNNCSTLFEMIRAYREKHKIELECEYQVVLQTFPNYYQLPSRDKLRAFELGLKQSDGCELKSLMLARAVDSTHWLERRTNFTASLAMTSIAGYILGLGDRHMMNIMIETHGGKLVHIDFGDCFEVAINREMFPEKVPFRLSRQLEFALELAGIRGTLRSACQNIARLLRGNVDQILGLLSMFTYDPLQQWGAAEVVGGSEKSPEAKKFVRRIRDKLTGNDFEGSKDLSVETQIDMLIDEATDHANLCQMFKGWYPWW